MLFIMNSDNPIVEPECWICSLEGEKQNKTCLYLDNTPCHAIAMSEAFHHQTRSKKKSDRKTTDECLVVLS